MEKEKRVITIRTSTEQEKLEVGTKIHNQLVGNDDYINTRILLNMDDDENIVTLTIFEDSETIPEIKI